MSALVLRKERSTFKSRRYSRALTILVLCFNFNLRDMKLTITFMKNIQMLRVVDRDSYIRLIVFSRIRACISLIPSAIYHCKYRQGIIN